MGIDLSQYEIILGIVTMVLPAIFVLVLAVCVGVFAGLSDRYLKY